MAVAFSGQTPQPLVTNAHFVMGIEPEYSDRQPFNSNTCPAVLEPGDMAQYPASSALQLVSACGNDDDEASRRLNPKYRVERSTQTSDSGGPLPVARVTAPQTGVAHLFLSSTMCYSAYHLGLKEVTFPRLSCQKQCAHTVLGPFQRLDGNQPLPPPRPQPGCPASQPSAVRWQTSVRITSTVRSVHG